MAALLTYQVGMIIRHLNNNVIAINAIDDNGRFYEEITYRIISIQAGRLAPPAPTARARLASGNETSKSNNSIKVSISTR